MDSNETKENEGRGNENSISSDLIRGHINTIILRTLYDGDKYGYEIINEIEEKSKGQYSLKQPTLYSALKRLESQDYVTSYWGGVSNGGRRKYFQITEKGRKIVEQNLAEWEYSRTVIDSLISEKDYDFSNPPPTSSVDFNLLKKSTTRVPISKGEEADEIDLSFSEPLNSESTAAQSDENNPDQINSASEDAASEHSSAMSETTSSSEPQPYSAPVQDFRSDGSNEPAVVEEKTDIIEEKNAAAAVSQSMVSEKAEDTANETMPPQSVADAAEPAEEPTPSLSEQDRQRIHENYKVLIGDENDATSYYYSQVARQNREERTSYDDSVFGQDKDPAYAGPVQEPDIPPEAENGYYGYPPQEAPYEPRQENAYADNRAISSELLYSNKPPAERNYKALLSKLYENTRKEEAESDAVKMQDQETQPEKTDDAAAPQQQTTEFRGNTASNIEFYDVAEKAENEGLRITTTNGSRNRTVAKSVGNTFDKGKALFITAVYVFIIAIVESIINISLRGVLKTNAAYVILPFVFAFVMLGIFLFLYLRGYGKNSRKSQSKSYISASLLIYANLFLIVCLIAYLIIYFSEADVSVAQQIVSYAVFPCIFFFNIPLFAMLYNYNCNKQ